MMWCFLRNTCGGRQAGRGPSASVLVDNLLKGCVKQVGYGTPTVSCFDVPSCRIPQVFALLPFVEKLNYATRKVSRIVRNDNILPGCYRQPLRPDGGGN